MIIMILSNYHLYLLSTQVGRKANLHCKNYMIPLDCIKGIRNIKENLKLIVNNYECR